MRRTHLTVALIGLAAIATADASAMYHPGMGTFMQRDPGAGGAHRLGAGGAPAATGRFIPRDPTGSSQYADGMNLYQYVRSNPVRNQDPSGLITWQVNETFCEINAIYSVKTKWKGSWTEGRKESFRTAMARGIENTFNGGPYKIKPNNQNYGSGTNVKRCPCPNGFTPRITVIFYEDTLAMLFAFPDWQVDIHANPSGAFERSYVMRPFGRLDEADSQMRSDISQIPVVHEFGHAIGLDHPGLGVSGANEYRHTGNDRQGRPVDGTRDLMGVGMGLQPFYFDKWKNELNSRYKGRLCRCDYETK